MYVNKHIAEHATLLPTEAFSASASGSRSESYEDIARSVKAALASYEVRVACAWVSYSCALLMAGKGNQELSFMAASTFKDLISWQRKRTC